MQNITDYHNDIIAIDADYVKPLVDAIHLIIEGDTAAIIDTGVSHSAPAVMAALAAYGLAPEQVAYVILTHIHLDHAGGAGELMARLPKARLVVHPRGSQHMVDPSRLVAGTRAVYGEEQTERLYGTILPVPAERVLEAADEAVLRLGQRELLLLQTPGHALHHICIVDRKTGHIFTGDTFGLSYRQFDHQGRQFMFATTTPVHFDPVALHRSIDRLASFKPEAIYLTHYSQIRDIPRLTRDLKETIDAHVAIALAAPGSGQARIDAIKRSLSDWVCERARQQEWGLQGDAALDWLAMDIDLNAQGLEVWLARTRRSPG